MVEIIYNIYFWLGLALIFNISHTLLHVAFFLGYHKKYSAIFDGIVGYVGAVCVFTLFYIDRGSIQFSKTITILIGISLLLLGIYIHFIAQLDFHKYSKEMTIVCEGIYTHIRHPMYLGWSIAIIGAFIAARSLIGLKTFWIWILLIAICGYLEEVKLRKDLPKGQYENYSKKTWL